MSAESVYERTPSRNGAACALLELIALDASAAPERRPRAAVRCRRSSRRGPRQRRCSPPAGRRARESADRCPATSTAHRPSVGCGLARRVAAADGARGSSPVSGKQRRRLARAQHREIDRARRRAGRRSSSRASRCAGRSSCSPGSTDTCRRRRTPARSRPTVRR